MFCQNCKKQKATTFIKRNINGQVSEIALCSDCARKLNAAQLPFNFGSLFGGLLLDLDSPAVANAAIETCPVCGSTFADIANSGKVGCTECYEIFEDKLLPTIRRMHAGTTHKGKSPGSCSIKIPVGDSKTDRISALKSELSKAIETQNFERAAELRDQINELIKKEENGNEQDN